MSDSDATAARSRIRAAYDPELLRRSGRLLAERLADHLSAAAAGTLPVLPWNLPAENVAHASAMADAAASLVGREAIEERFAALVDATLARGISIGHPRFIGHQVPQPLPVAALFDAVASVTNQAMAVYEMGPWAMAVERTMATILGSEIGWPADGFSGVVTHGGSLANFTALLTARNLAVPGSWESGLPRSGPAPVLAVHSEAHYCVTRSAGMLGLGTNQVVRVGLDARRRMDPQRLHESLAGLRARGVPIVAVVACACATPIGAFDPLVDIADVCRRHDVWLHVDAAHGGAVLLSDRHRHRLSGIDRADSLIWDAHKMLFVPALCTFLLYRDKAHAFATFQQEAPYLYDPTAPGMADYDGGLKTVECSKRAAALGLWATWSIFGRQLFADLVDVTFAVAQTLHAKISQTSDFDPLHEPEANIVVFRHVPEPLRGAPPDRIGRFQFDLRRRLIESGEAYLAATTLDGVGALRATVMNPLTSGDDLDRVLDALRTTGRTILAGE